MTGDALAALYPSAAPAEAAKLSEPAPSVPVVTTAPVVKPGPAPADDPVPESAAATLYEPAPPPTREYVRFDEPPATPGSISLAAPSDEGWDLTAEGDAARARAADAMVAAGAGTTFAQEAWRDVVAASRPDYQLVAQDVALAQLRQDWGPKFEANVAAAQRLVQAAAQKDPTIVSYLEQTGLGNDPAFIRKLAARAAKMR
ncbi:hypothetical protein QFZ27_004479 [Inquilinus ginsengisoli]|uniref:hypothetical protein n=1 Tax=Inquilinus ginsengisoli TaxID=363840 RepID=UPI003D19C27E